MQMVARGRLEYEINEVTVPVIREPLPLPPQLPQQSPVQIQSQSQLTPDPNVGDVDSGMLMSALGHLLMEQERERQAERLPRRLFDSDDSASNTSSELLDRPIRRHQEHHVDELHQLHARKTQPELQYKCLTIALESKEDDCPICYETFSQSSLLKLNCDHVFCSSCCINHLHSSIMNKENDTTYNCPCCRGVITTIQLQYRKQRGITLANIKQSELSQELRFYCK